MIHRRLVTAALGFVTASVVVSSAPPALAQPDTPVNYPAASSANIAEGLGFDTCTAPSVAALRAWRSASPYETVNIYFGGLNRGCQQPNLTPAWVQEVTALGWGLLPTYMGHQPVCMLGNKPHRFTEANATSIGTSNAQDAISQAQRLGLLPGSALYADVEHYDRADPSCVTAVRLYVSAWTKTLHSAGYLAGVYVHQNSGLADLSAVYNSSTYARPDAVWMARWDGNPALTAWPTAPDSQWANHQRAKQYRGDHTETWGGVIINIDNDSLDAPIATVARRYTVTSSSGLNARSGPSTSDEIVGTHEPGSTLSVVCQGLGPAVGTTSVWDRLSDGGWVSDYYVSTPSKTTFSEPVPACTYPGQVTASSLNARAGPGTSFAVTGAPLASGSLASGSLAAVTCQKQGEPVGTTSVWNRLADGRWVTDLYVSNRSNTTWSVPIPRCP